MFLYSNKLGMSDFFFFLSLADFTAVACDELAAAIETVDGEMAVVCTALASGHGSCILQMDYFFPMAAWWILFRQTVPCN